MFDFISVYSKFGNDSLYQSYAAIMAKVIQHYLNLYPNVVYN